jgi:hypothetical protein
MCILPLNARSGNCLILFLWFIVKCLQRLHGGYIYVNLCDYLAQVFGSL